MTHEEMIAVITAHKEGMQIQISLRNSKKWEDCMGKPDWDFRHFDYRVKPEPKYRSYADIEECFADVRKHGGWVKDKDARTSGGLVRYRFITDVCGNGIYFGTTRLLPEELVKVYVWADDGSPCGVKEE